MSLFSTATGVAVVDTRTRPGTITLPLTSQIPNRYLQIKDLYGAFGRSSLTLSTQAGETFDDGTTSKVFTDPFTFFTLYAASTTKWAQLGGTQTIQQTISSLNVSSLTIGSGLGWLQLPPIQTVAVSTNTINADTIITNSTTSYYVSAQILYVSSIMGAVVGGGTGDVTTANLISTTSNLQSAATQFVSSLTVNAVTIGSGLGWLQLPPVQTVYASTTYVQGQALFAISSYFGNTSTATALQYNGLFGNFNNTVLAEVSTGAGSQEFLVFKGSSTSDRVRVQTTGTFVVETGVSARLWDGTTIPTQSNATPAFIINSSSNVGIQTASPGATLDVAGSARATTVSTQQLFFSSINGGIPLSVANLTSTTGQLQSNITNWSQYPTTSDITLSNTTGITVQDPNNALQLKSEFVTVTGLQGGYGYLSLAAASFLTSSSLETYSLGFSDLVTGTVSSFFIGRSDGVTLTAAPVYVSSLYLGNVGGTVTGQITTDATATDLFWKGSKLNNQTGGGGAIDYVSAFTVSTGSLEVSSISSYAIYTYGIVGSALFNAGPDPMAITTIPSGTIESFSDWTIRSGSSTIVDAVTSLYLGSSNDVRIVAPSNVYFETPEVFVTGTISTYSLTVFGPSTLTVQGWSFFENVVSSPTLITNSVGLLDMNTGAPSYLQVSSGTLTLDGGSIGASGLTVSEYVVAGKLSVDQPLAADSDNIIRFVDDFDPQGWYDDLTYHFTPTIAGYYSVSYQVWFNNAAVNDNQYNIQIRKGGNTYAITQLIENTFTGTSLNTTKIIYMNGTTDYLDFAAYVANASNTSALAQYGTPTGAGTFFTAALLTNGAAAAGVSQIIAGTNVTIDPVGGSGAVTINASGGGGAINYVSAFTVSTGFLQVSSILSPATETSSILTSSISFGTAPGWVSMGAVQAIVFSSIQTNTMLGYVSSLLVGTPSTNAFQLTGFDLQMIRNSAAKPVATTWSIGSDMRIKENITDADMDRCYTDIKSVKLRRFAWQKDYYNDVQGTDRHVLGFLAQEVSTIVPKAVETKTAFGYSDFQFLNIDQLNMSLYGAVKRTIQDKEVLESTVKGQKLLIESLLGTQTFILSTLNGLQGR